MNDNIVKCPNCDGKGHVMDGTGAMIACLSIVLIPLIFTEQGDSHGITREKCEKCKGKGFINLNNYL